MNYVLKSVKVSRFTQNTELQTPTNFTVDGCSAQAQSFECLNGPYTPAVSPVRSFAAKGIYLHEPLQGLNLNRRSISGSEPEMPVTNAIPGAWEKAIVVPIYRGGDRSVIG
jgi:hypothetical protein